VTFLLDGGVNNNLLSNTVVFNPNPETVDEFRVLTSNYNAEYGRNAGGIISVVTKSGTNRFHGSLYDYIRNDYFNANLFFVGVPGLTAATAPANTVFQSVLSKVNAIYAQIGVQLGTVTYIDVTGADATTYTVDTICKGTQAKSGQKLVGVLIDYGTAKDAGSGETPPKPRAACAAVPTGANGQQVLDAVADVRVENQLTCGIDGYPVKGCSVTVKNPPAASTEQNVSFTLPKTAAPKSDAGATQAAQQSDGSGFPWTLVAVVVVVLVLAGAGLAVARRGRNA